MDPILLLHHLDADGDFVEIERNVTTDDDRLVLFHTSDGGAFVPRKKVERTLRGLRDAEAVKKHGKEYAATVTDTLGDDTSVLVRDFEPGLVGLIVSDSTYSLAGIARLAEASLTPQQARRLARRLLDAAAVADASKDADV